MSAKSILPLFSLLSSHDLPTRLDASISLISALPLASNSASSTPPPPAHDEDTPYAIKRLINGLASSNDAARQGFAVALTELIARLPQKKAAEVLPLILTNSTPAVGSDSKEERNLLFARLLGLHSIIRSGTLFREESADAFKEAILALHSLAWKKSWIKESSYWVLVEGVRELLELEAGAAPEWRDEIAKWLLQRLVNDSREKARGWGPEKVALVLIIQSTGVKADYSTILSPEFPSGSLLSKSSLPTLAQAIKGSTSANDSSSKAPKMGSNATKTSTKGNSFTPGAPPHFVWTEIFNLYFPATGSAKVDAEAKAKWSEVWRVLVDQALFASSSIPLKSTGFSLISLAIQKLPPSEIPSLFNGEGVLRTFSNNLRKSSSGAEGEKTLNRTAEKLASSLLTFLTPNPTLALPLLKILISPPFSSHNSFDHKTIEKLVSKLDAKTGIKGWIKFLKEFALRGGASSEDDSIEMMGEEDEKAITARRLWAFDQILHVVKVGIVKDDAEILAELLEFFAVGGWFEIKKSGKGARSYVPTPAYNTSIQQASRSRFFSILTSLPPTPWFSRALGLLDNLTADSKYFSPIFTAGGEDASKEVREMYAKLEKVDEERSKVGRVLVEGVLLITFDRDGDDDDDEASAELLESTKDCLRVLFPAVIPASSAESDDEDSEEGEEPEPATVLIDLLLELLHRPSAFVKNIAQTVFAGFIDEIGEQGMELILEQIRPDEVAEGEDEDGDVKMVNGEGSKSNGHSHSDDSDDSDDDDLDSEDDDVDVDEEFRNELLAALEASGVAEQFEENEDAEDDESAEEELLDDDQMMALDDKLADIFKLQKTTGGKSKKAERMDDLHYRLRVVDLLETLSKQRASSPLLVLVVLPLFSIIRRQSTLEKELQEKSLKLLRQIVNAKLPIASTSSPQSALDALAELHLVSQTVDIVELSAICSQTSVFLVKAAVASSTSSETYAAIVAEFEKSFSTYLSKKNSKTRVQPTMTLEFAKRCPLVAWGLFGPVVDLAKGDAEGGAINGFRKAQAFEVANTLLTSQAALKTDAAKANVLAAIPSYQSALLSVLNSSVTSTTSSIDAARLKELIKLALNGIRITTSVSDSTTAKKLWKGEEFKTFLEEGLNESDRFKSAVGVKNLLIQVVGVLGVGDEKNGASTGGKRKSDAIQVNGDKIDKKVVKKSKKEVMPEVEVEEEEASEKEEEVSKVVKDKKSKKDRKKEKAKAAKVNGTN